jgi:hypothetical protein
MKFIVLAASAMFSLAQGVFSPADFINVNGDSLKSRYNSAVAQGRQGSADSFWVAYEMADGKNIRTHTSDGIEVTERGRPQRSGMFMLVQKTTGSVEKLRIVDLDEDVRVHDRRVYWLGKPDTDERALLLLDVARAATSTQLKKDSIFWLGQEISRRAGDELEKLVANDPEVEVQKQAVFALSQRANDESIPSLMRIAKDHPNRAVRQQAIFWLGQKRDPRVLDFFEQVLKK